MPIEFICHRCQHPQEVDESKIGQQVYCRVCYFELTVPAESMNKPIDESQLYSLDAQPRDVREMQDRHGWIPLLCDICKTIIGVRKEQVGEEIICLECGTKIIVPESIAEKAEARFKDYFNSDRITIGAKPNTETYSLRDETNVPTNTVLTNVGSKLFRVFCRLCGTMLFASEEQVGTFLHCHDCHSKTKVPPQTIKNEPTPLPPTEFEGNTAFDTENPSSSSQKDNLVPVICHLCGTRLYAAESQIGQFKTCPDCGQQTEIKKVPKHQMSTATTTSVDAYELIKTDEPAQRPRFRTLTDYRLVNGSLDNEHHAERHRHSNRVSSRSFNRPELPERPLTERFFVPFGDPGTWLPLVLFVAVIPLGATGLLWATSATEGGNKMGTFGFAIFTLCFGLLAFIAFVAAFSYLASFLIHFYTFTCSGMDNDEFKGEIAPFDYFFMGLWLFLFSFVAIIPGCFTGNFLYQLLGTPFVIYAMMRISHWFFFPIFFLSSMEEGSMLALLAKNTITSLYRQSFAWFRFYSLTGGLFALSDICLFVTIWLDSTGSLFILWITLFFFVLALQSLFFFRLLGRLAWLLEETDRQKHELEYERKTS